MRIIFIILLLVLAAPVSQAQKLGLDFDADGLDDFSLVSIQSDGGLLWSNYASSSLALTTPPFLYGTVGDNLAPGAWKSSFERQPLVIRKENNTLKWILLGGETLSLGTPNSTVIGGADIDGNRVLDPLVVDTVGSKYVWKIAANYFKSKTTGTRRYTFGNNTEKPFYYRSSRTGDMLATAKSEQGNTIITNYNIAKKQSKTITISGISITETPLPLRQASGVDYLALLTRNGTDTLVTVVTARGKLVNSTTLPGLGTVIVGNFYADAGEEIAIQANSTFSVFNPITGRLERVALPEGIPVDHININSFSSTQTPGTPTTPVGPCKTETLSPRDGVEGFLWKPISDLKSAGRGNLAVHIPARFAGITDGVDLYSPEGVFLETGTYGGIGNPNRPLYRFSKRGPTYPANTKLVIRVSGGCTTSYIIDKPGSRID